MRRILRVVVLFGVRWTRLHDIFLHDLFVHCIPFAYFDVAFSCYEGCSYVQLDVLMDFDDAKHYLPLAPLTYFIQKYQGVSLEMTPKTFYTVSSDALFKVRVTRLPPTHKNLLAYPRLLPNQPVSNTQMLLLQLLFALQGSIHSHFSLHNFLPSWLPPALSA